MIAITVCIVATLAQAASGSRSSVDPQATELVHENGYRGQTSRPEQDVLRLREGNGWLRTRAIFGDFALSLEFRLASETTEAGVGIRTLTLPREWPDRGYRVRLTTTAAGDLEARGYQASPAQDGSPRPVTAGEWHRLMVEATGSTVVVSIDGQRGATFDVQVLAGSVLIDARKGAVDVRNMTVVRTDSAEIMRAPDKERPPPGYSDAQLQREVRPDYTEGAMRRRVEGIVGLDAVVLTDGTVGGVKVTRWLDPELEHAALAAVRQWKFKPATLNGQPIPVIVEIEMTFRR